MYYIYLLECNDGSLYTVYTTDVARRVVEHNSSDKGARYTKNRRPVVLRYSEPCVSVSDALKREVAIKKLSRHQKLVLIAGEK